MLREGVAHRGRSSCIAVRIKETHVLNTYRDSKLLGGLEYVIVLVVLGKEMTDVGKSFKFEWIGFLDAERI